MTAAHATFLYEHHCTSGTKGPPVSSPAHPFSGVMSGPTTTNFRSLKASARPRYSSKSSSTTSWQQEGRKGAGSTVLSESTNSCSTPEDFAARFAANSRWRRFSPSRRSRSSSLSLVSLSIAGMVRGVGGGGTGSILKRVSKYPFTGSPRWPVKGHLVELSLLTTVGREGAWTNVGGDARPLQGQPGAQEEPPRPRVGTGQGA